MPTCLPLFTDTPHHPVVVRAPGGGREAFVAMAREHHALFDGWLQRHGAVLFRGADVLDPEGFADCAQALGAEAFSYAGGDSPRSRLGAGVYTSTEYPAEEAISLHHEMSYLPRRPRRLFFYCRTPARQGGQTSLANTVDVSRALPEDLRRRMAAQPLRYIRNFPTLPLGKSWQATYATEDPDEVRRITALQASSCEWREDGALRVTTCCPAFLPDPATGEPLWFNQAEQWHRSALRPDYRQMLESMLGPGQLPHECEFEDGQPLAEQDLAVVRQTLHDHKLLFDWEPGDLLMMDNLAMMHGREAFAGPRQVLCFLSSV